MIRAIAAIGLGLACFAAPDLLFARPMTTAESRCFETGEAVYQAVEPVGWDAIEPYQLAEIMSERAYIDCIEESSSYSTNEPDDDIYGWENYICK